MPDAGSGRRSWSWHRTTTNRTEKKEPNKNVDQCAQLAICEVKRN